MRRGLVTLTIIAALVAPLAPVAAAAQPLAPAATKSGSKTTYTLTQLVEALPKVEPLYVGYQGVEQFIPKAAALKKDARGCNLRQRMIISLAAKKPKVSKGCRMKGGMWSVDGGTKVVKSPKGLVLQPSLSYKQAWGQGAYAWTPEQRWAWATNTIATPVNRAAAVSNQSTQGLFSVAYLRKVERQASELPATAFDYFKWCMDEGGGIFNCILYAMILGQDGETNVARGDCAEVVRIASNAKAWGLTVDPATWRALSWASYECKYQKLITVEDETVVFSIQPASNITVAPTVPVPVTPKSAAPAVFSNYGTPVGPVITTDFFGLHAPVGYGNPGVQPGYVRIWDSDASWKDIEKSKGSFTWDTLSASIDNSMGAKVMYVLGNTPEWANGGKGAAAPPTNLQDAADFVGEVCKKFGSRISSYEVWNEGNLVTFWTGSMADLADLTQRVRDKVRECGSGAQVVASSAGARADGGFATRYKDYLNQLGSRSWPVDAYSVHTYPAANGGPEERLQELAQFKTMLALTGAPQKPVYDTELNYGLAGLGQGRRPIDDSTGAAYLAQTYIQSAQYGVDSSFWYLWTRQDYALLGMQFNPSTTQTIQAWNTLRSWLIGSRIQRCGSNGPIRECQFTDAGGYNITIVWSVDGTRDVDLTGLEAGACVTLQWDQCTMPNPTTITVGGQPVRLMSKP